MSRYDDGRRRGNTTSTSSSSSKMRMDTGVQSRGYGERDNSTSKRKELDNVMRKARESQSSYWNKKLLEAEERDPNRWRHSGYKELYVGGSGGGQGQGQSSSNDTGRNHNPRSPRSPRPRSPHSPKTRSPRGEQIRERTNIKTRPARSPSSGSTCSDKSCSVCSPRDNNRYRRTTGNSRSRSRSILTPVRQRHTKETIVSTTNSSSSRQTAQHRTRPRSPPLPPMPRPRSPPLRETAAASSSSQQQHHQHHHHQQQQQQHVSRQHKEYRAIKEKEAKLRRKERSERQHSRVPEDPRVPDPIPLMRRPVKIEKTSSGHGKIAAVSHPVVESSVSEDSDSSSNASQVGPPKMTLSERFGKMAQWSVDRRDMENMRITKDGENAMKVVIEGEERIARLGYDSPPPGHYPESLAAQGPRGLDCWDDVRVRYDYYKARGYLRDLTLDDYVKWEEWWYKYQEWLEAERYYEQWATSGGRLGGGGGRKRRGRRNNPNH